MSIQFVKASACGNDFLIIETHNTTQGLVELTRRLCDRHHGIGADGVEWLVPASDADVEARLINADGSHAEISGNGTRCVAAYLAGSSSKTEFVIRTGAGLKTCRLISRNLPGFEFETDMGAPVVGDLLTVGLSYGEVTGVPVSMGNPHYVMFVEDFDRDWQARAAAIESHRDFPNRTNVELVRIVSPKEIEIRLYERGVGETLSSGTGSSAAAVATIATGRGASPLRVAAPGGPQTVAWNGNVLLRGPAQLICRGEFFG
jgi:diaminopimelate epimerase